MQSPQEQQIHQNNDKIYEGVRCQETVDPCAFCQIELFLWTVLHAFVNVSVFLSLNKFVSQKSSICDKPNL